MEAALIATTAIGIMGGFFLKFRKGKKKEKEINIMPEKTQERVRVMVKTLDMEKAEEFGRSRIDTRIMDPEPTAWLTMKGRKGNGESFEVCMGEALIGRSEECTVRIPESDGTASRVHAILRRKPLGTMIHDKGATNGTYVNGQLVPAKKLRPGDTIRIGATELVYSELGGEGSSEQSEQEEQPDNVRNDNRGKTVPLPDESPASVWFIVQPNGTAGKTYGLGDGRFIIGRSLECDVVIDDSHVSSEHARLVVSDHRAKIWDLGGVNTTKVNGEQIDSKNLYAGDSIQVGKTKITFVTDGVKTGSTTIV